MVIIILCGIMGILVVLFFLYSKPEKVYRWIKSKKELVWEILEPHKNHRLKIVDKKTIDKQIY